MRSALCLLVLHGVTAELSDETSLLQLQRMRDTNRDVASVKSDAQNAQGESNGEEVDWYHYQINKDEVTGAWKLVENIQECETRTAKSNECIGAARRAGVRQFHKQIGHWGDRPYGCSVRADNIFFNTKPDGKASTEYALVCHTDSEERGGWKLVENIQECETRTAKSNECIDAARRAGVRQFYKQIGHWGDRPYGCSVRVDNIFFNTRPDGKASTKYALVCHTDSEERPEPEEPVQFERLERGKACETRPAFQIECAAAAEQTGDIKRHKGGAKMKVGHWQRVPSGCSVRKDGKVFYNAWGHGSRQHRNFAPVCTV